MHFLKRGSAKSVDLGSKLHVIRLCADDLHSLALGLLVKGQNRKCHQNISLEFNRERYVFAAGPHEIATAQSGNSASETRLKDK